MFKKKNCFYFKSNVGVLDDGNQLFVKEKADVLSGSNQPFNKEGADVKINALNRDNYQLPVANGNLLVRNNQSFSAKDSRSCVIVNLLSTAIIRLEMRLRNKKERIINKNYEKRPGLLRTAGQNSRKFINDRNKETL
jgi:hypothetical protein